MNKEAKMSQDQDTVRCQICLYKEEIGQLENHPEGLQAGVIAACEFFLKHPMAVAEFGGMYTEPVSVEIPRGLYHKIVDDQYESIEQAIRAYLPAWRRSVAHKEDRARFAKEFGWKDGEWK